MKHWFFKWLRFIWCKTLHIHWLTNHTEIYDNGETYVDRWCNLCGYWPEQDIEGEYDHNYYIE